MSNVREKINPLTNNPMVPELTHIFQYSTSLYYTFIAERKEKHRFLLDCLIRTLHGHMHKHFSSIKRMQAWYSWLTLRCLKLKLL
jgi:hypothetical protein